MSDNGPANDTTPGSYPEPGPGPVLETVDAVPNPPLQEIAQKRGWQTLLQSLGVDVAVAIALALSLLIGPWEGWSDVQWAVLAFVVAKSVVQAVIAWVIRRWFDQSGFRK